MNTLKTRNQVRAELNRKGMSVAEWARLHKVSAAQTYQFLDGKKKGLRGQAHRIAVLLGVKDGIL